MTGDKKCPDIAICGGRITRDFFQHICNNEVFKQKCHYYARRYEQLKTPINWVQWIAIEEESKIADLQESMEENVLPRGHDRGVEQR